MEPSELMVFLADEFDRLGIDYFVTGSMASIYFGEPRLTNDVDVVVKLDLSRIEELSESFPDEDFYCSTSMIESAIRNCGQFNVIHPASGLKADVIVADQSKFNQSRFSRRTQREVEDGRHVWFASPEDVVLKKLIYYEEGGSEKHIRDILGILRLKENTVDIIYIADWSKQLGIHALWQDVLDKAKPDNTDDEETNK